jgi:Head domain of trimeric autotransporter adhesin
MATPPAAKYPKGRRAFRFDFHGFGFGGHARAALPVLRAAVLKIGSALVGGDFTGPGRGIYAVDLQTERTDPVQMVANGTRSIAIGANNAASATGAIAIGLGATANGENSVGLGFAAFGGADNGIAIGSDSYAGGVSSNAIGQWAAARVDRTTVISGPVCGPVGNAAAQADWFQQLASSEVILRFGWFDAKVVDHYIMTLPAGCRFWPKEVGVIVSSFTGVTAQPFIHFGISGDTQKYLADRQTVNLTALGKREVFGLANIGDGETTLQFGIATIAAGAGMKISPYFCGVLMEAT